MEIKCTYTDLVDIDSLIQNPKNPNKHSEQQIELLSKILKYQGFRRPIVVSARSGFIVSGHGRLLAAKLAGFKKVPIDKQEYATEADEYADMVADNKIAELSESDLLQINDIALELGPDFDLDLLGIPDFHKSMATENISDIEINEKELDENIATDKECPSCGYTWS